jgi:hypothetical protein
LSDATTADPAPGLDGWVPLQLAVVRDEEAGSERERGGAQPEKESGRQGGSSAKWRGKGLSISFPWIYRSKEATLPKPRALRALTAGNDVHHQRAGPTTPKRPGARTRVIITVR